jgi:hypothetical protein
LEEKQSIINVVKSSKIQDLLWNKQKLSANDMQFYFIFREAFANLPYSTARTYVCTAHTYVTSNIIVIVQPFLRLPLHGIAQLPFLRLSGLLSVVLLGWRLPRLLPLSRSLSSYRPAVTR